MQAAFDDVIKAREDEERVKNEAQAYANGVVPEARGAAQRQIEEANGYKEQVIANAQGEAERFTQLLQEYEKAPQVTRERLYLDAIQAVYAQSSKVMVDVEGGNNVMYLPLDKLAAQSPRVSGGDGQLKVDSTNIRELTNAVTEQLRRDAAVSERPQGRALNMSGRNIAVILVALLVLVASKSLFVIKETERGVLLRVW